MITRGELSIFGRKHLVFWCRNRAAQQVYIGHGINRRSGAIFGAIKYEGMKCGYKGDCGLQMMLALAEGLVEDRCAILAHQYVLDHLCSLSMLSERAKGCGD